MYHSFLAPVGGRRRPWRWSLLRALPLLVFLCLLLSFWAAAQL
jgi:hypothetical protein